RLFHAHAEDADDRLAAQRRAVFLAVLAIHPRRHKAAPRLAIREERRRQFPDGLHVEIAERPAAGVRNETRVRVDLLISASQSLQSSNSRSCRHTIYCRRASSCGVATRGNSRPEYFLKFCWQRSQ